MSKHSWQAVGNIEWCSGCGTTRTAPSEDPEPTRSYTRIKGEPFTVKVAVEAGYEDCYPLNQHFLWAIASWMQISEDNGRKITGRFDVMASHSSLLRRLLTGGPVFKEAPPTAYSYPWVELLVNKRDDNLHGVREEQYGGKGPVYLLINQVCWTILEKLGPQEWIVTYSTPDLAACRKSKDGRCYDSVLASTKWRVWKSGTRPNTGTKWVRTEEEAAVWSIELVEGSVPDTLETSGY